MRLADENKRVLRQAFGKLFYGRLFEIAPALLHDTLGAAPLRTVGKGLGPGSTAEVREAWTAVYLALAGLMKEAAGTPAAERAMA